ncbi:MAG: sensor histidine kinase [Kiritimatiellae bacterium]|nr:sensor histidine kinase [Kiritimatiellia bacterium]
MALASLTVTNVLGLLDVIQRETAEAGFRLTGNVTVSSGLRYFILDDSTGAVEIFQGAETLDTQPPVRGDTVCVEGKTFHHNDGSTIPVFYKLSILSHTNPPPPIAVKIADLKTRSHDNKLVSTQGTVKDVFQDEIDHEWHYLVLEHEKSSIYAAVHGTLSANDLRRLSGADIGLVGTCLHRSCGSRRLLDRVLAVQSPADITLLKPAPDDPFDMPSIDDLRGEAPDDITAAGRRSCTGHVLCLYGRNILLEDANGLIHVVSLVSETLPRPGMRIKAVGLPATDLYQINLTSAIWKESPGEAKRPDRPQDVSAKEMLSDKHGNRILKPCYHGRLIRLTGTVQDLTEARSGIIFLKSDDVMLPVDMSANRGAIGKVPAFSDIEVTGVCVLETANWHSYARFPHATRLFIVPRTEADIRIVRAPPWWTAGRLCGVIGALAAALVAIFIWNVTLRKLADRKGRELMRTKLRQEKAVLKTEERTRLAVELHDSVAQMLTGISMEIEAARGFGEEASQKMLAHIDIAGKALKSCRDELRNCLWDLRSKALEETDMSKAVLLTLQPHVNDSRLSVKLDVPRSALSDNTAHVLLRIVRELVSNALRHSGATRIEVSGRLDGDCITCTVADNGRGFDPDACPGVTQGHFGLTGIRERLDQLHGRMAIDSSPGTGTTITISIPKTEDAK